MEIGAPDPYSPCSITQRRLVSIFIIFILLLAAAPNKLSLMSSRVSLPGVIPVHHHDTLRPGVYTLIM